MFWLRLSTKACSQQKTGAMGRGIGYTTLPTKFKL
nr:MAG TPA: hypothetical protein [Caudoviricetes sp.]